MVSHLFCTATITSGCFHSQSNFSIPSFSKYPFIILQSNFLLLYHELIYWDFPLSAFYKRNLLAFSCYMREESFLIFLSFPQHWGAICAVTLLCSLRFVPKPHILLSSRGVEHFLCKGLPAILWLFCICILTFVMYHSIPKG